MSILFHVICNLFQKPHEYHFKRQQVVANLIALSTNANLQMKAYCVANIVSITNTANTKKKRVNIIKT